ncbi:MAG: GNAT family protein [Rhizobiaceae bacterium]
MRLRFLSGQREQLPAIRGHGLLLRGPEPGDAAQWLQVRSQSSNFLVPWEPEWPRDDLTPAGFRRRLNHYERDWNERKGCTFFLFRESDMKLLGGLGFTNMRMGASRSCTLGYWCGVMHAGKGNMSKGVAMALPFAFQTLGMRRVEAACIPGNLRSKKLLERLGFRQEGLLRSYLEINGERRDHLLYALLNDDPTGIPADAD